MTERVEVLARGRANVSWGVTAGYSIGEGANSLVTNTLATFGLLYYTEVVGLSPALAGLALGLSIFWEGVTEPAMGYISDRTRARFGMRHPWMLAGGLLMGAFLFLFWHPPAMLQSSQMAGFLYLLLVNLMLRTGLTMFFIPYLALGFEISPSYDGRSRLQSLRWVVSMAANFAGPALAWTLFFHDRTGSDGNAIPGTSSAESYAAMSAAFAVATVLLVVVMLSATRSTIVDTRGRIAVAVAPLGFWREIVTTVSDINARWLFLFAFLVQTALMVVSSLQSYVYVYFLTLDPWQRSVAHGSTMVGMAIGSALSLWVTRRLDKRPAVILGILIGVATNGMLALLFLTDWLPRTDATAFYLFVPLHAAYWAGCGFIFPVLTAMVGDSAQLRRTSTGSSHDGSYSAIFSLSMRFAFAAGLILTGLVLNGIGFQAHHADSLPATATVERLGAAMFFISPAICLLALPAILRHPITRASFAILMRAAGTARDPG